MGPKAKAMEKQSQLQAERDRKAAEEAELRDASDWSKGGLY
jgi:hypothetical protein